MREEQIPAIEPAAMSRVDRLLGTELGIDVLQLMEVAGLAVATWARARFLDGDARDARILVLAGSGGNGGDALVAARLLCAWGAAVTIVMSHEPVSLRGAAAHQARIVQALGIPLATWSALDDGATLPDASFIIDGLLGFGLSGAPAGAAARLIAAANAHPAPILAIDLPSGLDGRTGTPYTPCIHADSTLTLALPKTGLYAAAAQPVLGELTLADIGVPPSIYQQVGVDVGAIFHRSPFLRVMGDR
jgi:NAD(P)H-hydrate epimerase